MSGSNRTRKRGEAIAGYLFILPNFLGFFVFAIGPILASFFIAFTDWDLIRAPRFTGLENLTVLLSSKDFWISLRQTMLFTFINVPIQTAAALGIAVLLNRSFRGINVLRTLFIVPWVTMPVAHGLTWMWLYNRDFGFFNQALGLVGVPKLAWLSNPSIAFAATLMLNIWIYTGYHVVVLLAALQNVPKELQEAALIDGAGPRTRFFRISLPMIGPILFYDLIVNMIGTLQVFDIAFALTNGGPGRTNLFYNLLLYRKGFNYWQYGQASAMGLILFLIIGLFTFLAFRFAKGRVNYDGA
jgi:multiple sugar transport system permease protein